MKNLRVTLSHSQNLRLSLRGLQISPKARSQISVKTLSPITYNQIPVVTTELLAKLYGCSVECIHRNHHRNKERFAEGKHYIIAKGADLQNLKISLRDFQTIAPNVRKLILWTERG